jgi:hypothetical protein
VASAAPQKEACSNDSIDAQVAAPAVCSPSFKPITDSAVFSKPAIINHISLINH